MSYFAFSIMTGLEVIMEILLICYGISIYPTFKIEVQYFV